MLVLKVSVVSLQLVLLEQIVSLIVVICTLLDVEMTVHVLVSRFSLLAISGKTIAIGTFVKGILQARVVVFRISLSKVIVSKLDDQVG